MAKYDLLIVGAGLYGAMAAFDAISKGKRVIVVDKNDFVGGFCHTENIDGIEVHKFGAHIFRTNSRKVWDFVNSVDEFIPFVNSPIARYGMEVFNLPFNMNTFHQLWGCTTPEEAAEEIERRRVKNYEKPYKNLEEFVLATVGEEIYEKFIKHYTEKQWARPCSELPVSVMSRIPIRLTFDNNYYRETYQGIPRNGYDTFINRLLSGADVHLGVDYLVNRESLDKEAENVLYTGPIDKFFSCRFGALEYRSVMFKHVSHPSCGNVQGVAVVNYTDDKPFTRTIEHKHFLKTQCGNSVVTFEYPCAPGENADPSYPILNHENIEKYKRYKSLANGTNVMFGGRLAEYRYYSMNDIIERFICE